MLHMTGAALFRLDTMLNLNKTFSLRYLDNDPTLKNSDTKHLDGIFFKDLAETPNVTKTILRRTFMMHL
jgi:hypothetical protein